MGGRHEHPPDVRKMSEMCPNSREVHLRLGRLGPSVRLMPAFESRMRWLISVPRMSVGAPGRETGRVWRAEVICFMSLDGKVAIVTGGNTGIGMAIVLALAAEGASIVIDYVADPDATEALEKQLWDLGDKVTAVKADVSSIDDLQTLIGAAVSTFGRLDIMVNNAGIETRTSILDTTEAQYEKVLDVNLKSAFFGTQLAAKQMIAQGEGGRIVNVTSVHEDWPMPGNTAYCLSKGGMRMLTRTAGVELAPYGVYVVGVGPGAVETPINTATMGDPVALKKLDSAIPIGRMARPEEIGSVVAFLAGPGASYLTATTVFADGGIMHSSPGL
jgi:glucose 1-dehydrogenase